MEGKKNELAEPINEAKMANFKVMPEVFYGGVEPKVEYKEAPSIVVQNKPTPPAPSVEKPPQTEMPTKIQTPPVGRLQKLAEPVNKSGSKKKFLVLFIILLLVFGGGVTLYYYQTGYFKKPVAPAEQNNTQQETTTVEQVPLVEPPIETPTSTATTTEEIVSPNLEITLQFPQVNLPFGEDLDADNLTDIEEEVFSTDPGVWDTDSDSYFDGQEIVNLYNPTGFAPIKIIDSGLVREYVNPVWKYRIYYPSAWQLGAVDEREDQILFNSISGEYVEVVSFPKKTGQTFTSWFAEKAVGQNFSDLKQIVNRFKLNGYERQDGLVAYFENDNAVFVLIYNPGTAQNINFKGAMEMMIQSFRFREEDSLEPLQGEIPTENNINLGS